jgi:hypothetical protein
VSKSGVECPLWANHGSTQREFYILNLLTVATCLDIYATIGLVVNAKLEVVRGFEE